VLVVWGGSYCDGILPGEIFQKKRLKELKARGIAKIIKVEKKNHTPNLNL
jgi:plasmid maintenance system antidote protein VapI